MMDSARARFIRALRLIAAAIGVLLCLWGIERAATAGAARLLSDYGLQMAQRTPTDVAVQMSPSDARAHYVRAATLSNLGEFGESVFEFERAVALRPADYRLWMDVGRARERANNAAGAGAAFAEAVRLAPYYAQPRWQFGNFLLRAGQREAAFAELSRAASSNPGLLPAAISLAWGMYDGDPRLVEAAIRPQTQSAHLALARYCIAHGQAGEALRLFNAAGNFSNQDRRTLLTELLATKQFPEAHELWARAQEANGTGRNSDGVAVINDGSFEDGIRLDDPGFGWQTAREAQGVRVSLDTGQPSAGQRSLRLDFNGDSNPALPVISQLVLVEPNLRYELSLTARTEQLVTGGLPLISVSDALDGSSLAQSRPLSPNSDGWEKYTLDFTTADKMRAVVVSVRRQSCTTNPCPIFGRAWLDVFSLSGKPEAN